MGNFTPLVHKEYEFEGDKVNVSFARIKRRDMLNIMPLLKEVGRTSDSDDHSVAVSAMINVALDFLPNYVKKFNGLTAEDGDVITIETVAEEMYFIDLSTSIITDMIDESIVIHGSGPDAKKI